MKPAVTIVTSNVVLLHTLELELVAQLALPQLGSLRVLFEEYLLGLRAVVGQVPVQLYLAAIVKDPRPEIFSH